MRLSRTPLTPLLTTISLTTVVSDLHPLELLAITGAAVAAVLALFAPESRWRLVAVWVLLGTVVATVVIVGPRLEMYPLYLLAVISAFSAWLASRRVLNAPLRQVWRTGRGSTQEHVTVASGASRDLLRLLLFVVALALLAVPLGLFQLPGWLTG